MGLRSWHGVFQLLILLLQELPFDLSQLSLKLGDSALSFLSTILLNIGQLQSLLFDLFFGVQSFMQVVRRGRESSYLGFEIFNLLILLLSLGLQPLFTDLSSDITSCNLAKASVRGQLPVPSCAMWSVE